MRSAAAWGGVAVVLLCSVGAGCSHHVLIRSSPSGAMVRVDGAELGKTPVWFEETTGWSKTYRLELLKDGYEPLAVPLKQDDLKAGYACPAMCLCPPTMGISLTGCLFSYGLADEYSFELVPVDDGQQARRQQRPRGHPDGGSPAVPDAEPPPGQSPGRRRQGVDGDGTTDGPDEPLVVPF